MSAGGRPSFPRKNSRTRDTSSAFRTPPAHNGSYPSSEDWYAARQHQQLLLRLTRGQV